VLRVDGDLQRLLNQRHTRLQWRTVRFAVVTPEAACDKILPGAHTPARPGHHVIQGKIPRRQFAPAVLAREPISKQNPFPGNRAALSGDAPVPHQPDHVRDRDADPTGPHQVLRHFFHERHALANHDDGAARGDNIHRLIARIDAEH